MPETSAPALRAAGVADLPAMLELLRDSDLPVDGVSAQVDAFLVAEHVGSLRGMVGLEQYGEVALLRSLVVHEQARGTGVGAQLVHAIEARAQRDGAETLVLLTTTAAEWFSRFGFVSTSREAVPVAVTASVEFQGACPASAAVMQKVLRAT
jgi:amino-acid N-acetyltransferase